MKASRNLRRKFVRELARGLSLVWPILSALVLLMAIFGLAVARLEGWPTGDGLYFSFVTGLTIGYGDLVPKHGVARFLAVAIGFSGIVLSGLIAAVAVHALRDALDEKDAG